MSLLAASHAKPASSPADSGGLLALAQQGRHYEFLAAGYQLLGRGTTDAGLVMLMVRSLVALGLGGPARELLQHARQRELDIDVEAVRAMLVPIPIGRVPWAELQSQYDANVAALFSVQPELEAAVRDLESTATSSQLFRTTDGTLLLAGPRAAGVRTWNPGLFDPAAFQRVPIDTSSPGKSMLVVGLGAPGMLERVITETTTTAGEPGVLLLVAEADPARAFAALHMHHLAPLIEHGRMRFFLGEHAPAQLASFLEVNADVEFPSGAVVMQWAQNLRDTLTTTVQAERARRDTEYEALSTRLRARGEQRAARDHARRLAPGATILGFTSRFTTMLQYSLRDIGHALREHGYNFVLERELDSQRTHSSLTIARAIDQHDPALVVMINHFRKERLQAMPDVPVLTWIQDPTPTVLSRETGTSFTELDFACGYYITECTEQFGYPADRFFSLYLPVSSHIFHDAPLDGDDAERFACDVMYVGHRHADAESHVQTWFDSTPAGLHPLLDQLRTHVERLISDHQPVTDAADTVRAFTNRAKLNLLPADVDRIASYFVVRLHDILYRVQTLRWVAQWANRTGRSFKLYGRGWDHDEALASYAVGPVEHGEPLRKAYRGATIVLQTLPAGFMHQRTFEGLASGSLVLARHADTSSAHDHFPGVERVIFRSETELLDMLDGYAADEALRRRVTSELRDVVMRRFTYSAVLPGLIEGIRTNLTASDGASR